MPNITSTLTTPVQYNVWETTPSKEIRIKRSVTIQGGANVANKNFITPEGVVTEVTQDELDEVLLNDPVFILHLEGGFVKVSKSAKLNVKDMTARDESAPLTDKDCADKGLAIPSSKKD